MGKVAQYVTFKPNSKLTAYYIQLYSGQNVKRTAQGMADEFASRTAAIAYLLREANSPEMVKKLMGSCIEDAIKQYERRQKVLENGTSPNEQSNANSNVAIDKPGDHVNGNSNDPPQDNTSRH